jgi:POT family proton-dependent oligopeptide transporter
VKNGILRSLNLRGVGTVTAYEVPRSSPQMPRGVGALIIIQLLSILSFTVLFSSLTHFATFSFNLSASKITLMIAAFTSFGYILHVEAGFLGGRYFSFRFLYVLSLLMQILACALLNLHQAV